MVQPSSPIIVKLVEPPNRDPTGLAGVLIGALGLTGAIILLAVVLGAIGAALLFYFRRRT